MRILLAPDKFKGSLTARAVSEALAGGIRERYPTAEIRVHPLADGGDGTLDILAQHRPLDPIEVATVDPLGRPLQAAYRSDGKTAYIELATASGLVLLTPRERNPLMTTTYGTGILLAHALQHGHREVYLLLGGSATHDVGTGIARALGIELLDRNRRPVAPGGAGLAHIEQLAYPTTHSWAGKAIRLLCDVTNPLIGPQGSARVYAAQKGADPAIVERLEAGTRHFGALLEAKTGVAVNHLPGGGAAGGIAAGLQAMLGATLQRGFEAISELTGLEAAVQWADHVITGEGRLDSQSLDGKVVGGLAQLCAAYSKPYSIVAGAATLPQAHPWPGRCRGVHTLVARAGSTARAMRAAKPLLRAIGAALDLDS